MKQFNFEKLEVYQKSLEFIDNIYEETAGWKSIYRFSLSDQLNRASLSIALNIAEGSGKTKKEFRRYLSIARGSCFERVPIIEIALKRKLITRKKYNLWYNQLVSLAKMLSKLKSSI